MPIRIINNYLLLYLFIALGYYFSPASLRVTLFPVAVVVSFFAFKDMLYKRLLVTKQKKIFRYLIFFMFVIIFIQLVNQTITPFVLYIVTSFSIAIFAINNKFDVNYIKIPVYFFALICLFFLVTRGNVYGVFPDMSVNYISVVFVMNTVVICTLQKLYGQRLSILPSFLGLLFSLFGEGRSGVITAAVLFLIILFQSWRDLKRNTKTFYILFLIVPVFLFLLFTIDESYFDIERYQLLQRFAEKGIDSPARDILKREYLDNTTTNLRNFLLGYNYENSLYFQRMGQNPHNSYIRLHYYTGFVFFIVVGILLAALYKLLRKSLLLFVCLLVVLLRSYTDTVIFLTLYDFVVMILVYIAFFVKLDKNPIKQTLK